MEGTLGDVKEVRFNSSQVDAPAYDENSFCAKNVKRVSRCQGALGTSGCSEARGRYLMPTHWARD